MAKVKLTVRVEADLKAQFEGWALERERSVSWLVEQAMTRMRNELLGRKTDVSRETVAEATPSDPVENVAVARILAEEQDDLRHRAGLDKPSGERPHRHRYDTVVEGTASFDKGQKVAEFACECGDTKVQRWH